MRFCTAKTTHIGIFLSSKVPERPIDSRSPVETEKPNRRLFDDVLVDDQERLHALGMGYREEVLPYQSAHSLPVMGS